jgi:hypothetical protein
MRIDGEWSTCDDGVVRPVIRGEVLAKSGSWERADFLLDIGADRTVLTAALWRLLQVESVPGPTRLGGVGGISDCVELRSAVRLTTDRGGKVILRGQYAAVTELELLDISVLGRDITALFSVIADQPGDVVCLLSQRHRYRIEEI